MGQEMADGDLSRNVLVGIIPEIFAYRVVETELALLCKLHDCYGREHLIHRTDVEARLERVGELVLAICKSVCLCENRPAIVGYERCAREAIGGRVLRKFLPRRGD